MKFEWRTFIFVLTYIFFGAGTARADCSSSSCNNVLVEELYMNLSGSLYIQTSGSELLTNCTPLSSLYLVLTDGPRFKEIYAMLLAAQFAGKTVTLRINDGSNPCTVQYVMVSGSG